MNIRSKSVLETCISVKGFLSQPGLPANARVTALLPQVDGVIAAMQEEGTDQVSGRSTLLYGTQNKQALAKQLRAAMREISRTVKGLDLTDRPGLPAQFKMPRTNAYQTLLATARAFVLNVDPLKTELVASGLAADFDVALTALTTEFATAIDLQNRGKSEQVGGTAGLSDEARKGTRLIVMLNSVLQNLFKADPSLLAAWNSASHIERPPQRSADASAPTPAPAAAPTLSTGEGI